MSDVQRTLDITLTNYSIMLIFVIAHRDREHKAGHLANFVIMSDVNAHIIQPLKKFAKDSSHLVKKCTKPDRKGAYDFSGCPFFSRLNLFFLIPMLQSLPG